MYDKSGKRKIKIFLTSLYHPANHEDWKRFNEELEIFYNTIPWNAELIAGQDVNCNISVRSKMFRDLIWPNGNNNRNAIGKELSVCLYICRSGHRDRQAYPL